MTNLTNASQGKYIFDWGPWNS